MGKAKIDAVIQSPPYEGIRSDGGGDMAQAGEGGFNHYTQERPAEWHTQRDQSNIGNLKGGDLYALVEAAKSDRDITSFPESYWKSMFSVYEEAHRVLKPQGIMALVLKGFTRDGQYVDLPQQTLELCESLGFTHFDTWTRELWSLSFWRILQQRRDPAAFDERLKFEWVLAFRKSGEEANDAGECTCAERGCYLAGDCGGACGCLECRNNGVDAAVFSPPYAEGIGHGSRTADDRDIARARSMHDGAWDYTRPSKETYDL